MSRKVGVQGFDEVLGLALAGDLRPHVLDLREGVLPRGALGGGELAEIGQTLVGELKEPVVRAVAVIRLEGALLSDVAHNGRDVGGVETFGCQVVRDRLLVIGIVVVVRGGIIGGRGAQLPCARLGAGIDDGQHGEEQDDRENHAAEQERARGIHACAALVALAAHAGAPAGLFASSRIRFHVPSPSVVAAHDTPTSANSPKSTASRRSAIRRLRTSAVSISCAALGFSISQRRS